MLEQIFNFQRIDLAVLLLLSTHDTLRIDRPDFMRLPWVETVEAFGRRGVGLRSLTEAVDTGGAGGKLVFHLFAALAEFKRGVIPSYSFAPFRKASSGALRKASSTDWPCWSSARG
jgi:hypothetical protein